MHLGRDPKLDISAVASPERRYVAPGVAHMPVPEGVAQVTVTFVLAPHFTMLAFTSALEPFRVANQLAGKALFRWNIYSEDGLPVTCSNGVPVICDGALPAAPEPGHVLICGGVEPEQNIGPALANWVRLAWRRGCTVGGLCTGAYALARAGILGGRKFTLHWENIAGFCETFPDLAPARQVYCIDDRIMTCAGGVAAADLALDIIGRTFGEGLGQEVMDMCLLVHRRAGEDSQTASLATRIGSRNPKLLKAVRYMEDQIENGFDLPACAAAAGVTKRQLQRIFRQHLGVTPQQYMAGMRLRLGRMLLAETDLSVLDVAMACGYVSRAAFSRSFVKKYGISPQNFSQFGA